MTHILETADKHVNYKNSLNNLPEKDKWVDYLGI